MKKEDNYLGAKIMSFLFPFVGLIIYAINIGKNDSLAKKCGKWALLGVFLIPSIILLIALIIYIIPFIVKKPSDTIKSQVLVPDVQNMEVIDAIKEIERVGLKVNTKKETISSEDIDKDMVVKTEPSNGKLVDKDTKITIYISSGIAINYMPDFTKNYTINEVELFCRQNGLTLIKKYQETDVLEPNTIIKQSRAPKSDIVKGSSITITITSKKIDD